MNVDTRLPPKLPDNLEDAYTVILAMWGEIVELRAEVAHLLEENKALRAKVATLEEKLGTNSSNSSKPPSSDPPSVEKKKKKKGKRKRGGQPGHEGKTRQLLPADQVDEFVLCPLPETCECDASVEQDGPPERRQVWDLPPIKPLVVEYQILSGRCLKCGRTHRGRLPEGMPSGMLGPRAMATVGVLSGKYHLSKRSIESLLTDLSGLKISLGTVSHTEERVSAALAHPVEDAQSYVREQAVVHADETGHKVAGKKAWMWVAVTNWVSVFLIRLGRGRREAEELLGKAFRGILVSDRWSAYNFVDTVRRQLCWAHLLRDFKKISERGGRSEQIANEILRYVWRMFHLWHFVCEGSRNHDWFQGEMGEVRRGVEDLLEQGAACGYPKTERTCRRILKMKAALWTFVDHEGIEPTNNLAERTVRPYVLWRKNSFGTQSVRGNRFVERMMTISATCKQQGRNVLDYVTAAIEAHLRGDDAPTLLPDEGEADSARAA